MCDKHARCGHCIHEVCQCDGVWHTSTKFVDPVSGRYVQPPKKRVMVKKTSYPSSFCLTNNQYRSIRNNMVDEIVIVDTYSGQVITCFDREQLVEMTDRAIAKVVGETAEVYFVVRF